MNNTAYIMAFTNINNDLDNDLENLYFVGFDNYDIKDTNFVFRSNNDSDKIHKMHQVLYLIKNNFNNGFMATIKKLNNNQDIEYSQYIIYNDEFVFIDSNDRINKNILNLPEISLYEFI